MLAAEPREVTTHPTNNNNMSNKATHIALPIEQMKEIMRILGEAPAKYSHQIILMIEREGKPVNIEPEEKMEPK